MLCERILLQSVQSIRIIITFFIVAALCLLFDNYKVE